MLRIAVQPNAFDGAQERLFKLVAQTPDMFFVLLHVLERKLRRRTQAGDAGGIFRSGSAVALVVAAVQVGVQARAGTDIERSDSLGPVKFVRRKRQEVAPQLLH